MSRGRQSGAIPVAGERVGRWVLLDTIGVGGMATVWRAQAADDAARVVALKILHQARVSTDETRRLRREFLTLERLDHPHIVKVLEFGEHGGYPWLAMQYVPGGDLGKRLEAWKTAAPPDRFAQVERVTRALCSALGYVHDKGIVHRDLKPANVLVDEAGTTWLTDFGGVKDVESFHTNLTVAGRLVGTVAFMAPEQITGEPVDSRADLYGLGALMYAMLTGRRPVVADSIAGYLARQLAEMPKAPIELDPQVPPRLDRVCMRLLQKDPASRFATAKDVLAALDAKDDRESLPLHGQSEAVSRIDDRLRALTEGVSGCLLVLGPRGSGRTRLLSEVATRAAARSLAVAWAPDSAAVCLIDDADEAPPEVRRAVAERARGAVSGTPLLLVLAAKLPDYPDSSEMSGDLPIEDVAIVPLDRDALRALVRDHGASGGLGAALTRRFGAELSGWPGPTIAQLEALVEAGWLARGTDGSLRAVRTIDQLRADPLPLPTGEREAANQRLSGLSATERRAIEAIAVLAMPTSSGVIAQTAGVPKVDGLIDRLQRGGWLSVKDEGLQQLIELASAREGQAIRESLGPAAAPLHLAAAAALRERYGQRSSAISALVAHHLERGGRPAEARPLLAQAATASARRGDHAEAKTLAERAIALESPAIDGDDDARLRLSTRSALAEAFRALGRYSSAIRVLREALALGRGSAGERARLQSALGLALLATGDESAASDALSDGLAALPEGDAAWSEACFARIGLLVRGGTRAAAQTEVEKLKLHAAETRDSLSAVLADLGAALLEKTEDWTALLARAIATNKPLAVFEVGAAAALDRFNASDPSAAAALADRIGEFSEKRPSAELEGLVSAIQWRLGTAPADDEGEPSAAATDIKMAFNAGEWKHPAVARIWG